MASLLLFVARVTGLPHRRRVWQQIIPSPWSLEFLHSLFFWLSSSLEGLDALPTVQEGQAHAGPGRQAARSRPRPLRVQEEIMTFCVRFVFISETRLSLVAWPTELSSCVSTRSRLSFISLTRRTKWQTWMFGLAKVPLIAISSFLVSYQLLIYCSVSLCFIYC